MGQLRSKRFIPVDELYCVLLVMYIVITIDSFSLGPFYKVHMEDMNWTGSK